MPCARCRRSRSNRRRASCSSKSSTRARPAARPRRRWCSCAAAVEAARDKEIGGAGRPIVPDEARTFGMESLFRGRHLLPRRPEVRAGRHGHLLYYKEAQDGQILEEGSPRRSALVVHRRRHGVRQPRRQHDPVLHLLLDVRVPARRRSDLGRRRFAHRGFLLGGTAGRTTLAGEGLQHQDGNSHVFSLCCRTASPTTRPTPTSSR